MAEKTHRNSLSAGHKLHWYVIDRVLGQGGFGITYLAHDTNLDQQVAVKEYLPMELAVREGDDSVYPATEKQGERYQWGLERFLTEARTLAKFKHPSIVRVLSVFEDNNTAYMVMEYEQGEDLQELLTRRGTLSEGEILRLLVPLFGGLKEIHASGFIHRDIKPANILIRRDGSPVLLDFGSARQALGQETRTLTSVVSPGYAPFEQYYSKSDKQGPWTDIYGLGATLYRAIAGRAPMDAIDRSEAILKAERDIFVPAVEIGAGRYSADFLEAVDHALQFRENKRPQSIDEWRAEFQLPSGDRAPPDDVATNLLTQDASASDDERTEFRITERLTEPLPAATEPLSAAPPSPGTAEPAPRRSGLRALAGVLVLAALGAGAYLAQQQGLVDLGASLARMRTAVDDLVQEVVDARRGEPAVAPPPAGGGETPELAKTMNVAAVRREREIAALLDEAQLAVSTGRIVRPAGSNALELYQKVLALDADNEAAKTGLQDVGNRLVARASEALSDEDFDEADSLLRQAEALDINEALIAAVRKEYRRQKRAWEARTLREQEIQEQLDRAEAAREAGRLTAPAGDNALSLYRKVLARDPTNAEAEYGVRTMLDEVVGKANAAIDVDDFDTAKRNLDAARAIAPDSGSVSKLQQRFDSTYGTKMAAAEKTRQIEDLLDRADDDLSALRLSKPAQANALYRYRQVLELDPDNVEAQRGIDAVVDKYVSLAQAAMQAGEIDKAQGYIDDAAGIAPDAPGVKLARDALALRRAGLGGAAPKADRRAAPGSALAAQAEQLRREIAEKRQDVDEGATPSGSGGQDEQVEAQNAAPKFTLVFDGLSDEYRRYGLAEPQMRRALVKRLADAGFEVVPEAQALAAPQARLLEVYLRANYSESHGTYSYAARVSVRNTEKRADGESVFAGTTRWARNDNGTVRAMRFGDLKDRLLGFVDRYIQEQDR